MKGHHNRDLAIERLLRESRFDGPSSQPCVDAEALAAWSEGTLTPAEARAIEAHLAQCEPCRSMLAVFARAEPGPLVPAAVEPIWRRWRLQWLVPATAAAAALALWVAVPSDRPVPPTRPGEFEASTQAVVSPDDGTVNRAVPLAAPVPPATIPNRQAGNASSELRQSGQQGSAATDQPGGDGRWNAQRFDAESTASRRREEADATARTGRVGNPSQPLPLPRIGPAETDRMFESAAKAEASAAGPDRARRQLADRQPAAATAAPSAVTAPDAGADAAGVTINGAQPTPAPQLVDRVGAVGARLPFEVESPDARHRWRVDPAGQVQHSSTAGSAWQPVSIAGSDVLTAGMSPDGSVCWLVGRNGAVWMTVDGLRFVRRPLTEPVDLISVRAADASHATVAAADGRRFVTADGGVRWSAP